MLRKSGTEAEEKERAQLRSPVQFYQHIHIYIYIYLYIYIYIGFVHILKIFCNLSQTNNLLTNIYCFSDIFFVKIFDFFRILYVCYKFNVERKCIIGFLFFFFSLFRFWLFYIYFSLCGFLSDDHRFGSF